MKNFNVFNIFGYVFFILILYLFLVILNIVPDAFGIKELINKIENEEVQGGTNLYSPVIKSLELLSKENNDEYNTSVILMTDGEGNTGYFSDYKNYYQRLNYKTRYG